MQEHAGDGLVIALAVAVHPADALIVGADQARQLLVDGDIGPPGKQIGRGGEMRLVGPLGPRQGAGDEPLADMLDLGVVSKVVVESVSVGLVWRARRERA